MIYRSYSPIVIATKGKEVKEFFDMDEFRNQQEKLKGFSFRYIKGLGTPLHLACKRNNFKIVSLLVFKADPR